MENIERRVRREVITKAIARQLTWSQAAQVLGITERHMRRVRRVVERHGMGSSAGAAWGTDRAAATD